MSEIAIRLSPRLRELEGKIEVAQERAERAVGDSTIEIGGHLSEIRRTGMWKDHRIYATWAEYLRGRFNWGVDYGNKAMRSAKQRAELEASTTDRGNTIVFPANEAQTRELGRADDPATVWQGVVEEHAPEEITAAVIREHVERSSGAVVRPTASHSDRVLLALAHAVTAALQIATQDVVLDVVMEAMAVK